MIKTKQLILTPQAWDDYLAYIKVNLNGVYNFDMEGKPIEYPCIAVSFLIPWAPVVFATGKEENPNDIVPPKDSYIITIVYQKDFVSPEDVTGEGPGQAVAQSAETLNQSVVSNKLTTKNVPAKNTAWQKPKHTPAKTGAHEPPTRVTRTGRQTGRNR